MKKTLFFTATFALCSMIFSSCNQCDLESSALTESFNSSSSDYFISIEEAINNSNNLLAKISNNKTRSAKDNLYRVEYFSPIEVATRSESTPGFYIVNYEDDGFAILSNDRRLNTVYAISETGNISMSDTLKNLGFKWYVNNVLKPDVETLSTYTPEIRNPLDTLPGDHLVIIAYDPVTISKPLIPNSMTTLQQGFPFNIYCPKIGNQSTPTGCVPLSAGTIMGYFEYPLKFQNWTFDWYLMKLNTNITGSAWSRLFELLGRPENLNTDYSVNGSSTLSSRIIPAFTNFGYHDVKSNAFNASDMTKELTLASPVLVTGHDPYYKLLEIGHAWIIDGAFYRQAIHAIDAKYHYDYYYHCLWGWENSMNNGYYLISDRTVSSIREIDSDIPKSTITNFDNLTMYYNFRIHK